jgi:uncharacterized protein YndB with AHSA1/START domain
MNPVAITVTHRFDVPAERVFDAWLDAALIGRWMFGPTVREERVVRLTLDPRVGGRFSFVVERLGAPIDHVGEFLEIDRPNRLAFTWGVAGNPPSRVVVTFVSDPKGCHLTLVQEMAPEWAEFADRTEAGWHVMMGTLDRELHPTDGCLHPIGTDAVRMERLFPGPLERVWDYLVDPDKRGLWLAAGPMELRLGGAVELQFRHADLSPHADPCPEKYRSIEGGHVQRGTITQIDPPRRIGFTWGRSGSEVVFELIPQGTQVRLVLTHSKLADPVERDEVTAGWHAHADVLADRLHRRVPPGFWSRHALIEALYLQRKHTG